MLKGNYNKAANIRKIAAGENTKTEKKWELCAKLFMNFMAESNLYIVLLSSKRNPERNYSPNFA